MTVSVSHIIKKLILPLSFLQQRFSSLRFGGICLYTALLNG